MCFSASASFTSAALLAIIGALALKKIKAKNQFMFALVPLLFALQQVSEGLLWLSLQEEQYASLEHIAKYVFLFFAYIVWPTWIPLSLWLLEKDRKRQHVIRLLAIFGGLVSGYLASILLLYPITPEIIYNNIAYGNEIPMPLAWGFIFYPFAVIAPLLISSIRYIWIFGVGAALALFISYFFWYHALGSVWCFFTALLSGMILFFLDGIKKRL